MVLRGLETLPVTLGWRAGRQPRRSTRGAAPPGELGGRSPPRLDRVERPDGPAGPRDPPGHAGLTRGAPAPPQYAGRSPAGGTRGAKPPEVRPSGSGSAPSPTRRRR